MVEPVTAEPGHHRLDDGERRAGRDRRIDRMPPSRSATNPA